LFGLEVDLAELRWESDDLVTWHDPCGKTDTLFNAVAIAAKNGVFVGVSFNPVIFRNKIDPVSDVPNDDKGSKKLHPTEDVDDPREHHVEALNDVFAS
jgi:hypothetical protein